MPFFRIEKTRDYTVMSNCHLRDRKLSLKAKGLLSLMLSLPEDWDFSLFGLSRICDDGVCSVRSGVTELERRGYLARRRIREVNGQLGDIEYTVFEKPMETIGNHDDSVDNSAPECGKPAYQKPICENPTLAAPMYADMTQSNI